MRDCSGGGDCCDVVMVNCCVQANVKPSVSDKSFVTYVYCYMRNYQEYLIQSLHPNVHPKWKTFTSQRSLGYRSAVLWNALLGHLRQAICI